MLSVLSLELRFQIFSYVFSTEDEGLIALRVTQRGDWASDMGLPPYATLLEDPQYHKSRNRRRVRDVWPDPVEEAFHKGGMTPVFGFQELINCRLALRWTAAYQHRLNGSHISHTDEMISKAIYEYTGQWRDRKKISSHIQQLRKISSRMPEAWDRLTQQVARDVAELGEADRDDISKTNRYLARYRTRPLFLPGEIMRYSMLLLPFLNGDGGRAVQRSKRYRKHTSGQKRSC